MNESEVREMSDIPTHEAVNVLIEQPQVPRLDKWQVHYRDGDCWICEEDYQAEAEADTLVKSLSKQGILVRKFHLSDQPRVVDRARLSKLWHGDETNISELDFYSDLIESGRVPYLEAKP